MRNLKTIRSEDLFPAITELLANNQKVRITVTGDSMMPFLRENTDSVELSAADFNSLRFGQIVLIRRTSGLYILHRIVRKRKDCFYISGDAHKWVEGPLYPDHLIAVVTKIWRNNRQISPSNIIWQALSCIWWLRLPIINLLRIPYRLLKKVYKHVRKN
jgi:hypothetical protein